MADRVQLGPVSPRRPGSPELVRAEELKQQKLVVQSDLSEQRRLTDIAYPMMRAAVPLCGRWITTRTGVAVSNIHAYSREFREAAEALGFSDTLTVVGVAVGSAAQRAGLVVGDRVVAIGDRPAPRGRSAIAEFGARTRPKAARRGEPAMAGAPLRVSVRRQGASLADSRVMPLDLQPDTVCAYGAVALKDQALNAWADGQQVIVTTAMMRFAATEEELAVVVAHEIAHNAMRHIDAKNKNATAGAFFGLLLDIAAATQGVNTGGDFTNSGAQIGAMSYSQDFEREADYVGMYILARAGRNIDRAPDFWRRMAQESPGSIKYAASHPTTAERFLRLEQAVAEIRAKQLSGRALLPEVKAPAETPRDP
ncbi:MAG TPA: M48 family metallopeptidase [Gemmatimonadaceae bacterium]|nr:M48 family metallopeptidase [Gemmatimonadaceae bacterium]